MADYKQLKTLTIDGTTFGLQEGIGEIVSQTGSIASYASVPNYVKICEVTVPKDGVYIVEARISFYVAATTGATTHGMKVVKNGSFASADEVAANTFSAGSNTDCNMLASNIFSFSKNDVVSVHGMVNKNINTGAYGYVRLARLLTVPTT